VSLSIINGAVRVSDGALVGVDVSALAARHNQIARQLVG
jgi:hypothetical protein